MNGQGFFNDEAYDQIKHQAGAQTKNDLDALREVSVMLAQKQDELFHTLTSELVSLRKKLTIVGWCDAGVAIIAALAVYIHLAK